MDITGLKDTVYQLLTVYGLRVVAAIAILIIGRWVAKGLRNFISRLMAKNKVDETLNKFVTSLSYVALLAFVVIAALNQLGIQTASFIAILGAAGLAVGLALQGSLSNFAAGVLMIIFRPIAVNDFIEGAGVTGTVEEIKIFTTTLITPDNKTIFIPNAKLMGDNIINYTTRGTRRVDVSIGIGYGDDIDKARKVIEQIVSEDERIEKDPAPAIVVSELADSSVNFSVRVWASADQYWSVYFDILEKVKKRFDAEGISIPFPQQDVHLYQH